MLAVAGQKPHADQITWIESPAQSFKVARRFDLIVMTGHAFQVLLTDAEINATFRVMRDHLAPSGRIAFETRNPMINWAARWHRASRNLQFEGKMVPQDYCVCLKTPERITFDTVYTFPDACLTSTSTLRFATHDSIVAQLGAAGLRVRSVRGDWNSGPFDMLSSDEMIFIAQP